MVEIARKEEREAVARRCMEICEKISEAYYAKEARKFYEFQTDAVTGANDCSRAIESEFLSDKGK
jgi:hypothetical protein